MLMLKRISALIAILALALSSAVAQTRSIKSDRNAPVKFVPTVGERLNYDVSWADFITAGELTLETKERRSVDGVDAFHVSAQAQSVGLVSAIALKVNDVYESFLNAATLRPFRAEKTIRHGQHEVDAPVVGFCFLERIIVPLTGGGGHGGLSGRACLRRPRHG